jgi:hypothetical protein
MPEWDLLAVEPVHFVVEPVTPLGSQRVCIGREPDNLVSWKEDELRLRLQSLDHRIN